MYYGLYYEISKQYDKMEYYYGIACEKGNVPAMYNLGSHYYCNEMHDLAEKYLCMGALKKNYHCMFKLGNYYWDVKKDRNLAITYYKLCVQQKYNKDLITTIGTYYICMSKDYDLAIKYLAIGAEHNDYKSMLCLSYVYCNDLNYVQAEKYLLMALQSEKNNVLNETTFNKTIFNTVVDKLLNYYEANSTNQDMVEKCIQISYKTNRLSKQYDFIETALQNNHDIQDYHLLKNYIFVDNLRFQIMKHNRKTCDRKNLFINLKNILVLLKTASTYKLPKYIINDIIYFSQKID